MYHKVVLLSLCNQDWRFLCLVAGLQTIWDCLQRMSLYCSCHVIDTAHIVCGARSMKLSGVHPFVRPSVCSGIPSFYHCILVWQVCYCGPSWQRQAPSSVAFSSKCEQCHIYSCYRRLNTNLWLLLTLEFHAPRWPVPCWAPALSSRSSATMMPLSTARPSTTSATSSLLRIRPTNC